MSQARANALPASPELIGLYIANCTAPDNIAPALSVSTIERRLSGLAWHYQQRGFALDLKDRHIASVLAGIRRKRARPPVQKEAVLAEGIRAMIATLPFDLRGLQCRAILLIGYAGGLWRPEIVSLDHGKDDTPDSGGWVQIEGDGAVLFLRGKTGWREVEIGRGSIDQTCPLHALEHWLHFAKIDFGPLLGRTTRDNRRALDARLALFFGHGLRAGMASSAEVDERYIQKQLGHASAAMTRQPDEGYRTLISVTFSELVLSWNPL